MFILVIDILQVTYSFWSYDYWYSVTQNAIGCAIGSLAAIVISIWIYHQTIKETNKSLKQAQDTKEINELKAFSFMLSDAIALAQKQYENICKFITALGDEPNTFPKIKTRTLGNLKRIIDTITVEDTGLSYMKHFHGADSAKEFTSILETVDYLYFEFKEMNELVKMASQNHYDRQIKFSCKLPIFSTV